MSHLNVFETFTSIQGESSFAGLPFLFIRLAGCNLKCSWCDTPKSQETDSGTSVSVDELLTLATQSGLRHICITGGEPLLQDGCIVLMEMLLKAGFIVSLETNGTVDVNIVPDAVNCIIDVKCPSAFSGKPGLLFPVKSLKESHEVKFVIASREDYDFAVDFLKVKLQEFQGKIFFSAVSERLKPAVLANWILSDRIPVRVQVQLHKILDLP